MTCYQYGDTLNSGTSMRVARRLSTYGYYSHGWTLVRCNVEANPKWQLLPALSPGGSWIWRGGGTPARQHIGRCWSRCRCVLAQYNITCPYIQSLFTMLQFCSLGIFSSFTSACKSGRHELKLTIIPYPKVDHVHF